MSTGKWVFTGLALVLAAMGCLSAAAGHWDRSGAQWSGATFCLLMVLIEHMDKKGGG